MSSEEEAIHELELGQEEDNKSDSDFSDEDNLFNGYGLPGTHGFWKPHYYLYGQALLENLSNRFTEFAVLYGLSLAYINSFVIVPSFCLTKIFRLLFSVQIQSLISKYPRLQVVGISSVIHRLSQAMLLVLTLVIFIFFNTDYIPWDSSGFIAVYITLLLMGIISELSELLSTTAMNTDWLMVVSNSKQYMSTPYLTELNLVRQRVVLFSKIIAPLLVAGLFHVSISTCLIFLIVWSIISGIVEFMFLKTLYQKFPDLISARLAPREHNGHRIDDDQPLFTTEPFKMYFNQTSFLASISYTLIQFSVLCPGAIIINYMVYLNVTSIEIALLQILGSGIGIIAVFVTPQLIEWFGLSICGLVSLWLVIISVIIGFVKIVLLDSSIWLLILPLILSRIFFWSFEIVEKQIVKESVDDSILYQMIGIESQLSHLVTVISFLLAIMSVTPKNFINLAIASICSLLIAGIIFSIWFRNHGKAHELSSLPDIID